MTFLKAIATTINSMFSLPSALCLTHLAFWEAQSFIQMPIYDSWHSLDGKQHIPENCKDSDNFKPGSKTEWVIWMNVYVWWLCSVPVYIWIKLMVEIKVMTEAKQNLLANGF